jgi:hypothetical protein
MPSSKLPLNLTTELSKCVKLSNIQNGLPPALRVLPVAAILAGGLISKVTKGDNPIERLVLGPDEMFLLKGPNDSTLEKIKEKRTDETANLSGRIKMMDRCGHEDCKAAFAAGKDHTVDTSCDM